MALSSKIQPAHILRLYVWNLLVQNMGMEKVAVPNSDGGTDLLIPVIPVSDEPKLSDSGKSYIIYGFAESESRPLTEHHTGTFTMRILARNFAEFSQISNIVSKAFESDTDSAMSVNAWSSDFEQNEVKPFIGIRFTALNTTYIEGADPTPREGDRIEGLVNVRYRYIMNLPLKTYQTTGQWV